MSREVITIPYTTRFGSFSMTSQTFDTDEVSEVNGNVDTTIYGHPRWKVSMSAVMDITQAEAAFWKYLLMKLRGKANRLALWDPVNYQPRGTMRGVPTLNAAVSAGATSIPINAGVGQANTTLLVGDMLQIGTGMGASQLVMVMADVTLNDSGVGIVQFEHYLRQNYASGTFVVWDHPVAYFANLSSPTGWDYATNSTLMSGFAFDLMEQWS